MELKNDGDSAAQLEPQTNNRDSTHTMTTGNEDSLKVEQYQDETQKVLDSLSNFGFQRLDQEPKKLHAQVQQLDKDINAICVENYEVHVGNYNSIQKLKKISHEMDQGVDELENSLAPLTESCTKFQKIGSRLEKKFKVNRETLKHNVQLLELLELPQLMASCVRQKLFDEALNLCSHASILQKRHQAINAGLQEEKKTNDKDDKQLPHEEDKSIEGGKGITIINGIVKEVDQCSVLLREQLLSRLKLPVLLPDCLNYIGYLKRLDAQRRVWHHDTTTDDFMKIQQQKDETRLRFEFLECRDIFFAASGNVNTSSNKLNHVSGKNPYRHLMEIIERNRRHWFDVVNMYNNVFEKGQNVLESIHLDGGILSRWISDKIAHFLRTLRSMLPFIQGGGSVENIIDQCMGLGKSLARVGADFRPMLTSIFLQRVRNCMLEYWNPIAARCHQKIRTGEWGEPLPGATSNHGVGRKISMSEQQKLPTSPPLQLLSFPVLAEFTNVMIMSFNDLAQCASYTFLPPLAQELQATLSHLVNGVFLFHDHFQQQQNKDSMSKTTTPSTTSVVKEVAENKEEDHEATTSIQYRFYELIQVMMVYLFPSIEAWFFRVFRLEPHIVLAGQRPSHVFLPLLPSLYTRLQELSHIYQPFNQLLTADTKEHVEEENQIDPSSREEAVQEPPDIVSSEDRPSIVGVTAPSQGTTTVVSQGQ